MAFPFIGYGSTLFAILMGLTTWFFTLLQNWQLQESALYIFGDVRQYAHVKWSNYVILHSFMFIARLGFHVVGIIMIGLFYTGDNLRDGYVLSICVLILTRNVVDCLGQLAFVVYYQYGRDTKYFLDLSTLEVSGGSKDNNTLETARVQRFHFGMWVFNYIILMAFIIIGISYAAVFAPTFNIIQMLVVIGGVMILIGLIMNMGLSKDFKTAEKIESFLKSRNKGIMSLGAFRVSQKGKEVLKYFKFGYIENGTAEAQILERALNPVGNVFRVFKDNVYELPREEAALADGQFPEKQAGVHLPQISAFLHPITGEKDIPYPHISYDPSSNHGKEDVPLFGVYNPEMIGYHIIFFRVWGFGIGTSSTLDTPEIFRWAFTAFVGTVHLCVFNIVEVFSILTIAQLLPPLLLSSIGQRQEYVTQFFYFYYFYWAIQTIYYQLAGANNSFVTAPVAWDFNMTTEDIAYNSVPEYIIAGSVLVIIATAWILGAAIQGCIRCAKSQGVADKVVAVDKVDDPKITLNTPLVSNNLQLRRRPKAGQ